MKIALVHDWFDQPGGGEFVVKILLELYPEADLFALVDFFSEENRQEYLGGKKVRCSFLQYLPGARKRFRYYLPLFSRAIESLDLRGYDLVLSTSHAVAKGIVTGPEQRHICYIFTPMRYAWDQYRSYLEEHRVRGVKRWLLAETLYRFRLWDVSTAHRVDRFAAISSMVRRRVEKYYRRDSELIYPPVDTKAFHCVEKKEDYYLTASRLVPYKKTALIVEAFNRNGRPLVVVGTGEEYERLKSIARPNVRILGFRRRDDLIRLMQRAKAFVYAAYEDFGIVPVEAMACGTPVIAYGHGGVVDTVTDGVTGVLFDEQSTEAINREIERFEKIRFDAHRISREAEKFSIESFKEKIQALVRDEWQMIGDCKKT